MSETVSDTLRVLLLVPYKKQQLSLLLKVANVVHVEVEVEVEN